MHEQAWRTVMVEGPFDWLLMLRYAHRRSRDLLDHVSGQRYRRLLDRGDAVFLLGVEAGPGVAGALRLTLESVGRTPEEGDLDAAEVTARRLFSLDRSPQPFYQHVAGDPYLGPICRALWGLRPLGSPSIFEMLITAILGQQISMIAAHAIKERVVLALGTSAEVAGTRYHAFPTPEALAEADPAAYLRFKFSRRKAEYVRDLAAAVAGGTVDLEALRGQPHQAILEQLLALRGIGRWTAEYVLLRGYGDADALPAGDAGLRRQVYRQYHLPQPPSDTELIALAEGWRPYRSWATLYLWSAEWAMPSRNSVS